MFKAHDIAKKQHRERHQPTERRKWGLLEKKKDYRQRAQDYHKKQAHLALLKSKASQFNDDEFNYGMIRGKTKDGVKIKERETSQALSNDAVRLLKTQDEGYIRTLEMKEKNHIKRATESMFMPNMGKHTVYVDDEKALKNWNAADHFDTPGELVGNAQNRQRTSQVEAPDYRQITLDPEVQHERLENLKELKRRVDRSKELSKLRHEVDLQRELMKKGSKRKRVDAEGRITYEWLNVRKR